MARKAREKSSTGVYAVILRVNGKIFVSDSMCELFTETAKNYLGKGLIGVRFEADHADMLVRESEKGISLDMKPFVTSFARAYNRETGAEGKVFRDRFKSVPVESQTMLRSCRAYMKGGDAAEPYISVSDGQPAAKKKASKNKKSKKSAIKKAAAVKPAAVKPAKVKPADAKPADAEPVKKPAKKKELPTWLL